MSDGSKSDDDVCYAPPRPPLPEGIEKEIIKEGIRKKKWKIPSQGDELTVHYIGTFENGEQFDSSRDRGEPVKFNLGKGEVIKGWDTGVASMSEGEIAKFTFQPEFAYGTVGQEPTIPPNAVLCFEIELLAWTARDDLFGDEGVIKSITTEGESMWESRKKGDEVCISLKVRSTKSGEVLLEKPKIDYILGSEDLGHLGTQVLSKCIEGMDKNETCTLSIAKGYLKGAESPFTDALTVELTQHLLYSSCDASVLQDRTVMMKTIGEGEGHRKPEEGFDVVMRVVNVTDASGVAIPEFTGPQELKFKCLHGDVCDLLETASRTMKKGEKAFATCTAAWKARERRLGLQDVDSPKIIFTLVLEDFTQGKELWARTEDDKIEMALDRKDVAAKLFSMKRFELALTSYMKVSESLGQIDSQNQEIKKGCNNLKRTVELNMAAVYLQLNDPTSALSSCNKVLKETPNNVKALFRRAKAHHLRNENIEAAADLERLLVIEPSNSEARSLLPVVRKAQKVSDKACKGTFAKMCEGFGKIGSGREPKNQEPVTVNTEPEEPEQDPENVTVSFKMEYAPKEGETLHVIGALEVLGSWDASKCLAMTKLPVKWEPPIGSGKEPPAHHFWETSVQLPQDIGRFEYQYLIRGPNGDRQETGSKHKCDITGLGGSRTRCSDTWRK